jgi:hypothetical protein
MKHASEVVDWAVERWNAEVKNRPLQNIHRRTLDGTWRQVMRRFGGDPEMLVGPSHDAMLDHQSDGAASAAVSEADGPQS